MRQADLVIVGAGCAGLALAGQLAAAGDRAPLTIVLDQRDRYADDRTWCFWAPRRGPWHELARARWSSWRIGRQGHQGVVQSMDAWPYHCVAAIDYYTDRCRRIESNPSVRIELATPVEAVEASEGGCRVETPGGAIEARQVVDTRPPGDAAPVLWQQFHGMEVRTASACFDPLSVDLMTDMTCDEHGFAFTYVLPFAPDHALVELTRFVPEPLARHRIESDCRHALNARVGTDRVEVVRREQACLPMGWWPPTRSPGHVVPAGVGAGALRSASGYGFLRIQAWARRCAESLLETGRALPHPPEPAWRRAMDGQFLKLIRTRPGLAPALFEAMANNLDARDFVRFLGDEGSLRDAARMIAALPAGPFIEQLLRCAGTAPVAAVAGKGGSGDAGD